MKLYPDQEKGKQLLIDSIRAGYQRIAFAAPCAYGKTVLMSNLTEGAEAKGKRVWIVVDSTELVEQTRATLLQYGIDSGVIQGVHEDTDYSKLVQVATAQTLNNRWNRFENNPHWLPHLVLADEIHIQYKSHDTLIEHLRKREAVDGIKRYMIGFSATPVTKGLGKRFETLVVGSTVRQLLDEGRLSPVKGYACHTPDMKGVKKKTNGDYSDSDSEKKMNTKKLRGDIVGNWERLAKGRKTIVFCVNVKHSLDVKDTFQSYGYKAEQIDGRTYKPERKQIIDDFRDGKIDILVSVGTIVKGFDVTDVGCIIDAQPTRSLSRHIQKLGRGMRINDKYEDCLILDHAGNLLRNGFPEDFEPDELDIGEKGKSKDVKSDKEPLPKPCPACGAVKPAGQHKCYLCGFEPEKQAGVEYEQGALIEIKKKLSPAQKRNKEHSNERKQAFYSSLLKYCHDKGRSHGWAAHTYRDYYGVWPNAREKTVAERVTDEAARYIQHKNLQFAKGRSKQN